MKKHLLSIISIGAILLLGASCSIGFDNSNAVNDNEVETNTNDSVGANINQGSAILENIKVNTNSASTAVLAVTSPTKDTTVTSPFVVEGTSSADKVYVSILGSSGAPLFTETVNVRDNAFTVNLTFTFTSTTNSSLVVAEHDTDGNVTNSVNRPLTFQVTSANDTTTNTNTNTGAETNSNVNN